MTGFAAAPAELPTRAWTVSQAQIDAYAAAAGADDPMHVDAAGRSAAGGTIAQGMLVLAVMAEYLGAALPNRAEWQARGALDVRFRAPARPGERLSIGARLGAAPEGEPHDGFASYELWCENEAGVRVVAGTARVPLAAFAAGR